MSVDFDVQYGSGDKVNWRKYEETDTDDALLATTPSSVVAMLGFDPLLAIAQDAEFKEEEHKRANNGEFAKMAGSGASKTKNGVFSKEGQPNASQFIQAYLKKNVEAGKQLYSNNAIALAAQELYGTKTSAFTVNGLKHKVYSQSEVGMSMLPKKAQGVAKNNKAIAEAATSPAAVKEAIDSTISEKSAFIKAGGQVIKLTAPSYFTGSMIAGYLQSMGYGSPIDMAIYPFDPAKPTAPNLKEITVPPEQAKQIETAVKAKAAEYAKAEAESNAPATELATSLNSEEKGVVRSYTDGGYKNVNQLLRHGKKLHEHLAVFAKQMDKAIAKSVLVKNTKLYRGLSGSVSSILGEDPHVGDVIMDNGFMSTSKSPYGSFGGYMKLEINMPKGAHALDVQAYSQHPFEKEVVLPRGSMFKIKGISKQADSTVLEVDYVDA